MAISHRNPPPLKPTRTSTQHVTIPQALIMYARPRLMAHHRCCYELPPNYLSSITNEIFPASKSRRDKARLQKYFYKPYWTGIQTRSNFNLSRLLFRLCSHDPIVVGSLVHTYPARVSAVIVIALTRIFGDGFWGCALNHSIFNAAVTKFVHLERKKSITVSQIMRGMQLRLIPWLGPTSVSNPDDLKCRTKSLVQFLHFAFLKLVIPLIRTCFYVTESQHLTHTPMFFLHHHWLAFKQSQLSKLLLGPSHSSGNLHEHGFRLLPKSKGSRILVKFDPKLDTTKKVLPVRAVLDIVSSFAKSKGVHLSRWEYVHRQIQSYTDSARSVFPVQTLYFVSCDVAKAFDNIDPFLATAMVDTLLPQAGPIRMRKILIEQRLSYIPADSTSKRTGVEVLITKPLLLGSILDFITNIGIRMHRRLHKVQGIPQGAKISPILCDIVLSKVQDRVSACFEDPHTHIIARWVDNWLFLTRNEKEAILFAHLLTKELACVGLTLKANPVSNVIHPSLVYSSETVWCGHALK